jgi:hypothetical protein
MCNFHRECMRAGQDETGMLREPLGSGLGLAQPVLAPLVLLDNTTS